MNRCTHEKCYHDDENDGEHRLTDQDEKGRHNHSRIGDVCAQARLQVGKQGGETDDAESKRVYFREQGKTTATTAEELKMVITSDEVYFVYNGRILRIDEVEEQPSRARGEKDAWRRKEECQEEARYRFKFFGDRRYQDFRDGYS